MKHSASRLAATLLLLLGFMQTAQAQQSGDLQANNSPRAAQQPKVKEGGKDDTNAIGNRDIGGRGLGNWYSLESEMRMGKQYAQIVESSVKLVHDSVITEYVNRTGQNIVRNSDSKVPFTIKVIDSDEVNAFALPGGFFYVNSGLLLATENEAELAGVMAHEIAHVAAHHAVRQITRANFASLASIPLIFVGGGAGYAAASAMSLGLPITFLKFSRGFEEEADYLGLQYLYKAGYDPQSFMNFFEKIQAKETVKPGTMSKIFASHPAIAGRIAKAQKQIETKLPPLPQYVVTRSEFDEARTRLAQLENRRQVSGEQKDVRPSLRRAPKTTDGTEGTENERPRLQRRDD